MVNKLVRLTAEQRNNFVAYLDGELEESESQQIEQLLAQNEVARHDVESLATAWELLDVLPNPGASEKFSEKTIATLKLENQQTEIQDQPWFIQAKTIGSQIIGWSLVIACSVAGYLVARSVPPSDADLIINNYQLLKNLEEYKEIGSKEFLIQLPKSDAWSRYQNQKAGGPVQ